MFDKYGRKLKSGDLIRFDTDIIPDGEPLRVRYERKFNRGWMAERLLPHQPTPQCIGGLGHRFVILKIAR